MVQLGVPTAGAGRTVVSIFMELPVAFAVAIGAFTASSAALMGFNTRWNCAYWASLTGQ